MTRDAAAAGTRVWFDKVTIAYGSSTIVDQLSLNIDPGEILALIGPSGSGKTTALRALAGFVRPIAGRILIGDTDVTRLPPYARDIGMVVQNYALFPHMKVEENVAFGLNARKAPSELIKERVASSLRMVGMSDFLGRYPRQLSGGQQQRIAIARALALDPRLIVCDEPVSALDLSTQARVLDLFKEIQEATGVAYLFVSHDLEVVRHLSHRVAVMYHGEIVETGDGEQITRDPKHPYSRRLLTASPIADPAKQAERRAAWLRLRESAA